VSLTPIRYDVPADLYKWKVLDRTPRTGEMIDPPDRVHQGTLGSCIRDFLEKPTSQRPLYEIFTEAQAAFTKTILSATDMLDIASREDFPKS
jgi:hypothetical protein